MKQDLKQFKDFLTDKGLTESEIMPFFKEITKQLKEKSYGIVWEEQKDDRLEDIKTHFPLLTAKKEGRLDIHKGDDLPYNVLIEGDNLHALKVLEYTHKKKIDFIYIDPPYNTGSNDFVYNDKFVNKEDDWRHSKWLSFMNKRLRMARKLLSKEGVVFISIDDNEFAQLKLLCDGIFGEDNFLGVMPRVTKKSGKRYQYIGKNHDYLIGYAREKKFCPNFSIEHTDKGYKHRDEFLEERGLFKLNQTLDYDSLQYSESMDYVLTLDGTEYIAGGDPEKRATRLAGGANNKDWIWRWSQRKFAFGLENGFIVVSRTGRIYTKTYANATIEKDDDGNYFVDIIPRSRAPLSLDLTDNEFSNDNAKKEFKKILPEGNFEYPKPTSLIRYLLSFYPNKDVTVLDFFAGTGTTAQAVLELNNEDGGNRKFIVCTNNEIEEEIELEFLKEKQVVTPPPRKNTNAYKEWEANLKAFKDSEAFQELSFSDEYQSLGICEAVTHKRIENTLARLEEKDGRLTNLKYFSVELQEKKALDRENVYELMNRCSEIISLKEDVFALKERNEMLDILESDEKMVFVVKNPTILDFEIEDLVEQYNAISDKEKVIYTTFSSAVIEGYTVKEYPEEIIESLKNISGLEVQ